MTRDISIVPQRPHVHHLVLPYFLYPLSKEIPICFESLRIILGPCIKGIIQYVAFCIQLVSLRIMFLRSTFVVYTSISLFLWITNTPLYEAVSQFKMIRTFIDKTFGLLPVWAITYEAVANLGV